MLVRVKRSDGVMIVCSLSQLLAPDSNNSRGNTRLELAEEIANTGAKAIGNLLELLVEKGVFTLEEAKNAAGCYVHIEPTNGS